MTFARYMGALEEDKALVVRPETIALRLKKAGGGMNDGRPFGGSSYAAA